MSSKFSRRPQDCEPRRSSTYPAEFRRDVDARVKFPVGDLFALDQFGVNIVELPPATMSSQRHWHSAEDEFIYILEGAPTLLTDAGEEVMKAGDCAGFKAGTPDGHCLVNRTEEMVRYLEVGTRRPDIDAVDYPDIDMKVEPDGSGKRRFVHRDGTPY